MIGITDFSAYLHPNPLYPDRLQPRQPLMRLSCLAALAVPLAAQIEEPRSPRLERLRADLKLNPHAEPEFWLEVTRTGTPLIEPDPSGPTHTLVTFLWRSSNPAAGVIVFATVLPLNDPARQRLARLPGTSIWHRTYRFRSDLPILYELSPDGQRGLQPDPLNPLVLDGPLGGSIALLPAVRHRDWSSPRNAPPGTRHTLPPAADRTASVYLPPGFKPGSEYPVLVVLDEDIFTGPVPLPTILDNLIAARRIPPLVAVLAGSRNRDADLASSPAYAAYLAEELLPAAARQFQFSRTGARTAILGSSLGGLAAACAALDAPEQFRTVAAISGSFRWRPESAAEPEWLARRLATAPPAPVRFLVAVGTHETGTPEEPGNPSLLTAARHLRDVLQAKDYDTHYHEFPGAHDPLSWTLALPDLLPRLFP